MMFVFYRDPLVPCPNCRSTRVLRPCPPGCSMAGILGPHSHQECLHCNHSGVVSDGTVPRELSTKPPAPAKPPAPVKPSRQMLRSQERRARRPR